MKKRHFSTRLDFEHKFIKNIPFFFLNEPRKYPSWTIETMQISSLSYMVLRNKLNIVTFLLYTVQGIGRIRYVTF